ncbi:MAG: SurA N-terminal domain-containing protein [Gemmatimonadota bacterium]
MLDVLRRNAGSWAIKIILTFIALTFVIWGVGSYTERDRTWAARIGKEEITAAQLAEAAAGLEKAYRDVYGNAFTPDMAKALRIREQALNALIKQEILLAEARKLGLVASDVEVQRDIASNPAFQVNGQFSEAQYRRTLDLNRLTTTAYEAARRREITLQKMEGIIAASARVPEDEARDLYDLTSRKIRLLVVTADPQKIRGPESASDAEIAARYEQSKESLRVPARVRLLVARFDPDVFARGTEPSEDEIRSFYEGNPDKFRTDESRLVEQVVVAAPAKDRDAALRKAQAILAEAGRGKSEFEAAARKQGAGKPAAMWATRKDLRPEIADAVFAAGVGQGVGPIEVAGGYVVARVNQIRFPETEPLSRVHDRVVALLKREKGRDAAVIKAYQAHAKAVESKDLKAACAPFGVVPFETGWTSAGKGAEIPAAVVQEALMLPAKEIGPVKTVGDVHYLFEVTAKEDSRIPPLSEVRDAVRAAVLKDKRRAAAQAAVEKALAGAGTAADLRRNAARAGLAVSTTAFLSPVTDPPPEPVAAVADIRQELVGLTAKSPVVPRALAAGPRFVAIALDGEQAADEKTWEAKKASITAALAERKRAQMTEACLAAWKKEVKVEINPDALK